MANSDQVMSDQQLSPRLPKGVIIAGPTASGKTGLAIKLAMAIDGVVINADSMQIYRDLPIITAIPGEDEQEGIPHYGYQMLDGSERCSVGHWLTLTRGFIQEAIDHGKVPILVGGTGMYIRAALEGISPIPDIGPEFREDATRLHQELGGAGFRQKLRDYDPKLAERLHDGDTQRLIRGMEVVMATGKPLSVLQDIPPEGAIALDWTVIRLAPPREQLYAMIDQRYPKMLESGGLEEAQVFAERALDPSLPLMKAVGLPPLLSYFKGELALEEAVSLSCRDSRRYAKRQTTWFNNQLQDNFCQDLGEKKQYMESFIQKILSNITFRG